MAPKKSGEKRKADAPAGDVPNKEAKKDDSVEAEKVELEKDAANDTRGGLKSTVGFDSNDFTLNVVPMSSGKLLMPLTEGGMQFLVAGARANVGMKTGRYVFEAKIAELMAPLNLPKGNRVRGPAPRQVARVGFSAAGADLVLGEQAGSVFFDAEGFYVAEGAKKTMPGARFMQDQVIAVVLNLDAASPNKNTVSLFKNGLRVTEPQALPDALVGKTLYPHVSFRNLSMQVNFGPSLLKELPFRCRCLQAAAAADVEATKSQPSKKTVHFPVGIPDEGVMDWADGFLAKNPSVTELSDRKILDWCVRSGICKMYGSAAAKHHAEKYSNDKPEFNFAVPALDDMSVRRLIASVSGIIPRDYLVLEVKGNLTPEDRMQSLRRFPSKDFKRVAHVAIGKPDAAFIAAQQESMLKHKQETLEQEWKAEKVKRDRKKLLELRAKQIQEQKRIAEERRKKKNEEAKKAKVDAEKKKDGEEAAEQPKEEEESAGKEEAMEEAKEAPAPAEEAKEDEETGPPTAELTEEEKSKFFRPQTISDVTPSVLGKAFSKFALPTKEEGFDEVKFEWDKEPVCKTRLQEYLQNLRLTCRVADLKPGKWFSDKSVECLKTLKEWQEKQKSTKAAPAKNKRKAEDDVDAGTEDVDIDSVEDVCDTGGGKPLFEKFAFDDWVLLQLRLELHLMAKAFAKDADERKIPEQHFDFYYTRYFQKQLVPTQFGVESRDALLKMVQDTVKFTDQLLESEQPEDVGLDTLLKLAEARRRERQRRIDAGDETVRLKFSQTCMQTRATQTQRPGGARAAKA